MKDKKLYDQSKDDPTGLYIYFENEIVFWAERNEYNGELSEEALSFY